MREEEAPGQRAAARGCDADLRLPTPRSHDLPLAGLAPQLRARLVEEAIAVEASGRELAAVRVERQQPVARDALSAFDERSALALAAEAESLEPAQRDEA